MSKNWSIIVLVIALVIGCYKSGKLREKIMVQSDLLEISEHLLDTYVEDDTIGARIECVQDFKEALEKCR